MTIGIYGTVDIAQISSLNTHFIIGTLPLFDNRRIESQSNTKSTCASHCIARATLQTVLPWYKNQFAFCICIELDSIHSDLIHSQESSDFEHGWDILARMEH